MSLPALRNLDIEYTQHEGQAAVALRDPEGYTNSCLVLSPHAFFIAACLNGENDVETIQTLFLRQFMIGQPRPEDIEQVVKTLDGVGFLMTDTFYAMKDTATAAFRAEPARPAYLAGKSYPEDPGALTAYLDEMFGGTRPEVNVSVTDAPTRCLIVPHIDFDRGAPAYAAGYRRMVEDGRPDTVLVFGVAHTGASIPFILTKKSFETPLGPVHVDTDAVDALAAACAWDPYVDEIVHRSEHSIEFQAVMLAYLYGPNIRIIPILCGPFLEGSSNSVNLHVDTFLYTCSDIAGSRRVTVMAGADLAHVGRRFGDDLDIDEKIMRDIEDSDREDLSHALAIAPNAFRDSVLEDGNWRRVCGVGCIYAALRTVEGVAHSGELLYYGSAPDPLGGMVSFASLHLT